MIAHFEQLFTKTERTEGWKLYDLGCAFVLSIVPKESADIQVKDGDEYRHVIIRTQDIDKPLICSCTCEIYNERRVNCRHIWTGLIVAAKRGFFQVGKREAHFVLQTERGEAKGWSIQLYYRYCNQNGEPGPWEKDIFLYRIDPDKYEPKYRKAIRSYKAANDKARNNFKDNFISPDFWQKALVEISKTKAFGYSDAKSKYHDLEFVPSSVKNPLCFIMNGHSSGKNLRISGTLVARNFRTSVVNSVMATSQFAIIEGRLFCANLEGCGIWFEQMKKSQVRDIDQEDINAFLTSFYSSETIPKLVLPSRYKYKIIEEIPKVRLIIDRVGEIKLSAELEFRYGDEYVDRLEKSYRILDHDKKLIYVRQFQKEREFRNKLALLLQKSYGYGNLLLFKESKLKEIVNDAFDLKWEVVAFKKHVSQMKEYKLKATSGIDWFDLHLNMKFTGGETIPLPDLLREIKSGKKMISLADGTLGIMNDEVIKKFSQLGLGIKIVKGKARISKAQALYFSSLLSDDKNFTSDTKFRTLKKVRALSARPTAQQPDSKFKGKLRSYQKKGLGWLDELTKRGIGCLLADDMGLGKTVMILALLSKRLDGQALIVVPKTLIRPWEDKARKFVPHLKIHSYYGPDRRSHKLDFSKADVIITTYHTLRSDVDILKKFNFDTLVVDEAQYIKNPNSAIHKACRHVNARKKVALTGTPIENSLNDLFAIFNIITPGLISNDGWERYADADDPTVLKGIQQAIAPFVLRRRKEDVLKELPPKDVEVLYVNLSPSEKRDYSHLAKYYWKKIEGEIDKNGIHQSSIQIFEALLRMRQAASHQGLLKKSKKHSPSSKFDLLIKQLKIIIGENHKVLIFSNFIGVLQLLKRELNKRKIGFCYMDGRTSNRKEIVYKFQTDESKMVFLMTIKTGGVGLDLTAASYVFIMDPWWNPATEIQAIDRTHRIGQKNKVMAYKLIAKDTVEEKVLALQAKKSSIADAIVGGKPSKILKNISKEDLKDLFS